MTTTSHTAPHAPRTTSHARPLDAAAQERQRHLNLMGYGDGAIELVAGSNEVSNPDKIALLMWTKATYGTGAPHTRAWVSSDDLPAAVGPHGAPGTGGDPRYPLPCPR